MRYVGREIDDIFVLGYGLHHQDLYRNLPGVYIADRATVLASPEAYLPHLYPGAFADAQPGGDPSEPGGRVIPTRNGGGQ